MIATEIDTDTEYDSSVSSSDPSVVQGSDYPDGDAVIVYDPRLWRQVVQCVFDLKQFSH